VPFFAICYCFFQMNLEKGFNFLFCFFFFLFISFFFLYFCLAFALGLKTFFILKKKYWFGKSYKTGNVRLLKHNIEWRVPNPRQPFPPVKRRHRKPQHTNNKEQYDLEKNFSCLIKTVISKRTNTARAQPRNPPSLNTLQGHFLICTNGKH